MAGKDQSLLDYAPPVYDPSAQPNRAKPKSLLDCISDLDLLNILNGTGIPERFALINDWTNPLVAIPKSQAAAQDIFAPDANIWDRIISSNKMLTELGNVALPVAAAYSAGLPAAVGVADKFSGTYPTARYVRDRARGFLSDEW